MTLIKNKKLIGIGLIIGSLPLFTFFLSMAIPVISRGLVDDELSYMMLLFFTEKGFALFHYPAIALIGLGTYLLIISKQTKKIL